MKVLIVDDNPEQLHLLSVHLTAAGHQVDAASDGQMAWDMMLRSHYRLVITDWMMPRLNGTALIRRIRAAEFAGYTYIIMLSGGREGKESVVAGLGAGAADYLAKPFNLAELRLRVSIGERILNLEARLTEMATRDHLTGLFNRRAFDLRFEEEIQRVRRYSRPLALVMLDIDHFKHYNDTHGHPKGDGVLSAIGGLLLASVRRTDFAARYGGEEFVIVLPETLSAGAVSVAERIRTSVAEHPFPFRESQPGGALTLSVGVAACPDGVAHPEGLLKAADQALYRAKQDGRNRVAT